MKAALLFVAALFVMIVPAPAQTAKPLTVEPGQTFAITVDSNQSTGYEWQLAKPLDPKMLKLLGVQFVKPQSGRPGAGGQEMWEFRAVKPGKAEIRLKYARPWLKSAPPAKTTNVVVLVTAPKN